MKLYFLYFYFPMSNRHKHTDEELVILFKENDVVAFREIYVRYWYELYLISNKRLRSKEASEEIIQNFFTLFWINRKKINIRGALKAYLHTSIRYSVIDYLAREATRNNYLELLSFSYKEAANTTEETVFLHEVEDGINQVMSKLPAKCRKVFELSRQHHKSNKEIAELLGLSEKTVENHITNALKLFRLHFKEVLIASSFAWLLF
ncbi:RNA polymerase sigma-70 factor [Pedobacter kyonggii]|uniref:RNA polymerase sigma-70 factor n=1 Tax=Pedobacter kyonggii TaxID=1926871 RepID=A0A4Q9H923_9SPHI|nr:RNA polymerase sigma-70 factor [Pedobacter kyonggii]TBO40438.1 RNA polymerase sigma-70 factor [Pedobacter kyonggii]